MILATSPAIAQSFNVNASIGGQVKLTLGNQNQKIDAGILAIGAMSYGDAAIESTISLFIGQLLKRHTIKQFGTSYGYEFFTLAGVGKNSNLLGAGLTDQASILIFNPKGQGGFNGIGFGVVKEFLPKDLDYFTQKRGKLLLRFSNTQHSFDITFMNDFRFKPIFNGDGTDFGNTGSLKIGYTRIISNHQIYRTGIGLDLFTPKPDYSKTPNNSINSDDGRNNVWHTEAPFKSLFYTNIYAFGQYKGEHYSAFAKAGINSEKLGAYIQNTLHDDVGLNPRFPWNVTAPDKVFIEVGGSILNTERYEN